MAVSTEFSLLLESNSTISVEADWVKGEYAIFIGNYPSGKATKAQVMERLEKASTERFPNAVPKNVADALYPAFDPDNKGEVDFIAAAKVSSRFKLICIYFEKGLGRSLLSAYWNPRPAFLLNDRRGWWW